MTRESQPLARCPFSLISFSLPLPLLFSSHLCSSVFLLPSHPALIGFIPTQVGVCGAEYEDVEKQQLSSFKTSDLFPSTSAPAPLSLFTYPTVAIKELSLNHCQCCCQWLSCTPQVSTPPAALRALKAQALMSPAVEMADFYIAWADKMEWHRGPRVWCSWEKGRGVKGATRKQAIILGSGAVYGQPALWQACNKWAAVEIITPIYHCSPPHLVEDTCAKTSEGEVQREKAWSGNSNNIMAIIYF